MKKLLLLLGPVFFATVFAQTPPPAPAPAPPQGPIITWADANDQDYYGYNGYNYSDGRYESRGNHRGADRARGGGGRGGGRR
ncbi:hypothetical protein EBT11_08995 [bacterium]|nr:hypothetical protein [bacterium]